MPPPLRLYTWGPAFGLASIDAECLAAIAYFRHALEPCNYELVATSPSAVPTNHLPALHNTTTDTWASGYQPILDHIHANAPTAKPQPRLPASTASALTAHTSFLTLHAAPLLSLSLYVSSANYSAATRPALSALLPFPLGWTESPARRRAMSRRAEHLGLSGLDTDREDEMDGETAGGQGGRRSLVIPKSLQPRRAAGVSASLTPEARARIRLEAAAAAVLDVLASAVGTHGGGLGGGGFMQGPWTDLASGDRDGGQSSSSGGGRAPSPFECLAFGYLALMLVPDLPRPWLREVLEARYPTLCEFVSDARIAWFGPFPASPTPTPPVGRTTTVSAPVQAAAVTGVASRFAVGVLCGLPGGVGEAFSAWRRGWRGRLLGTGAEKEGGGSRSSSGNDLLLAVCTGLVGASVAGAALLFRSLQPFGASVQRFERERRGLAALGAVGAALFTAEFVQEAWGVDEAWGSGSVAYVR